MIDKIRILGLSVILVVEIAEAIKTAKGKA